MTLFGSGGCRNVMRHPGERHAQCCFKKTLTDEGGSFMFWAGISLTGRTDVAFIERGVLNAQRYVLGILEEYVVPYGGYFGENFE